MNGIDICNQRARRFVAEDFDQFDKIYALAKNVVHEIRFIAKNNFDESKIDLLMNELYPGKNMDVQDPWSGPERGYLEAFALINKACEAIIEKAQGTRFKNKEISPTKNG